MTQTPSYGIWTTDISGFRVAGFTPAQMLAVTQERDELLAALKEAENALADYIPTIERTGASLNYGHKVLRNVRAAIQKTTNKEQV